MRETHNKLQLCEERKNMGEEWNVHAFMGDNLLNKSKFDFPKLMACPNTKLIAILFHSQGINCPNQFLEEINDWANKTKKVVDNFMGSPIDIWLYPIGSRV